MNIALIIVISISALTALCLLRVYLPPRVRLIGRKSSYKIYVALGFHINLYHSYRIDTNDEAGFGKDIRIIRKILEVLDKHNRNGSKARAVWDMENLFSLEEMLPRHAPDIIAGIKRRVDEGRDEIILMSYNNGMMSAMDEKEFSDSMKRTVGNDKKSGVKDVFGAFTPFVRPQEVMTTPGNFRLMGKLGVRAAALYYSAIPFDAFRVFTRKLDYGEAMNPLSYVNRETGEKFTIIPSYNIGDLVENVSFTRWARNVRRKQLSGELQSDVLIFINHDADDAYWYGYDLPSYLKWMPNTGGIDQLIGEIDALDYTEFTTLAGYLAAHPPTGEIEFGQDTADGNFSGYDSWAQKFTSHRYWTAVVRNRRNERAVREAWLLLGRKTIPGPVAAKLERSYEDRLRLLSTTNFGLATPFLARNREAVVESLIASMEKQAGAAFRETARALQPLSRKKPVPVKGAGAIGSFRAVNPGEKSVVRASRFLNLDIDGKVDENAGLLLRTGNGALIRPRVLYRRPGTKKGSTSVSLFIPPGSAPLSGHCVLYAAGPPVKKPRTLSTAADGVLDNGIVRLVTTAGGTVEGVYFNGKKVLEAESLIPGMRYARGSENAVHRAAPVSATADPSAGPGTATLLMEGVLTLPGDASVIPGSFSSRCTVIDGMPFLLVESAVTFPETKRTDIMKTADPRLRRAYDAGWVETFPAELKFAPRARRDSPFRVLKRNFLGVETSYPLDYYKHSDSNLNLSGVNNHITAEYAALAGGGAGIVAAMEAPTLGNFAFCPMKMIHDVEDGSLSVSLNPFGAYFGPQYYYPTWGDGLGMEAALMSSPQYYSSAPSYNGRTLIFRLMISFFDGDSIPEKVKKDSISFAHPPVIFDGPGVGPAAIPGPEEPVGPPSGLVAGCDGPEVHLNWEKARGNPAGYRVLLGSAPDAFTESFETPDPFFSLSGLTAGSRYYAGIASLDKKGEVRGHSETISFRAGEKAAAGGMNLPLSFQLRTLLAVLKSFID